MQEKDRAIYFNDVTKHDGFYQSVKTVANVGLMIGKKDLTAGNIFAPKDLVLRKEVVVSISKLYKLVEGK